MALVVKDRVKETTITTGTGTVTLGGAISGFQAFTSVLSNADTTYYAIIDYSNSEFEVGLGTFTSSGTTLARTTILESSNSGSAVDFGSGTKEVFITYPAEKSVYLDASNQLVINGTAVTASATDLNLIDGIANGAVIANKVIITDSNKDISGGRNITISGELDAATLDISGNADIDGTLEADAITIDGVTLAETISDTVGAMVSSNTETNITVTYDDSDNTLDFVIGTLNQDTTGNSATATALETSRTIHGVSFDGTANIDLSEVIEDTVGAMFSSNTETNITATYQDSDGTIDLVIGTLNQDTTGTSDNFTVTANNSTDETVFPVFVDGATGSQGAETDTGFTYNPSTGMLTSTGFTGALTGNASTATTLETARTLGGVSFNGSANINLPGVNTAGNQNTSGNATTATLSSTVTVTDSTANTNFPVVFHDESNSLLDDTGALRYNPSTGELLVPKLTVAGTTTVVDTVTMNAANAVIFEGATADDHETTLTITDPTADRTIKLPNQSGTLVVLAADSNTAVTSTPAEINLIDGDTSRGTTAVSSGDGILINDAGTMRMTNVDTVSTYFASHNVGGGNIVTTGALNSGTITSGFGNINTGSSTITTTGAVATGALTAGGILKTDDATEATSTTDGSLQTDGGLSVVKDAVFGDDVKLLSDAAVLSFGANSEVTLTHVHNDGLLLNSDNQLQFRDSAINIRSDADGDLDINADDEIELNSTLIDINGNVDISGTTTQTGVSTSAAKDIFNAGMSVKNGATSSGFIEFFEDSDNGTNKVTLIGPSSTSDVTLTLPSSAGTMATTASAADEATALAIALG